MGVTIGSIATVKVERVLRQKIKTVSPDSMVRSLSKEFSKVSEDFMLSVREGLYVVRMESSRSISHAIDLRRDDIEEFALKIKSNKAFGEERFDGASVRRCLDEVSDRAERLVR